MADIDIYTKSYMQDAETFADAFNFYVYNGRQVINPKQLKSIDTTEIALPYGNDDTPVPMQRFRDILKVVTAMEDDDATYVLLGIENQTQIHYAMPVRNMLYDAMQYSAQVSEISKKHKKNKDHASSADFLSGIHKDDKILPIITLTIYFGASKWDGPRKLSDMFSGNKKELMQFVSDYSLNLISPYELEEDDFKKFHTELSLALKYIKYSDDKKMFDDMIKNSKEFENVSKRTFDMINAVTKSNMNYSSQKEEINMCKALEDLKNDWKTEYIAEGRAEGMAEGTIITLKNLVKKGSISVEEAAESANMTVAEFKEKAEL